MRNRIFNLFIFLSKEPTYSKQELEQTLRTPQFRQAADVFGHALQTGQLAPVLRQFGIDGNIATSAGTGGYFIFKHSLKSDELGK